MSRVRWVLRTLPFTLLGVASHVVLLLAARGVVSAFGPWRLALLPAYVSALPAVVAAVQLLPAGAPPPAWFLALRAAIGLAPFLLADYFLARWRRRGRSAVGRAGSPSDVT